MTTRDRADLRPGDQFTRYLPQLKGKPRLTTYTVLGHTTFRGRAYVEVRSDVQGVGSIALDALSEQVALVGCSCMTDHSPGCPLNPDH